MVKKIHTTSFIGLAIIFVYGSNLLFSQTFDWRQKKATDVPEKMTYPITEMEPFADQSFPIVIYGMSNTEEAFMLAQKWGATHVHRYGMGKSKERDQIFFDRAESKGLKVMSDLRVRYWMKEGNKIESLRAYVQHFKDHPATGFWYLCDEPDNKGYSPGELEPFYEMIQQETPNVPIAMAHAWSKNWYRYGKVQDVFMYDYYPIHAKPFPEARLDTWTKFTKSAIKRGKKDEDAVIPVIQMFNWKAMAKKGQEKVRNRPVEELRYPNYEELRYMAFTSIALGADGLSFYSYARSRMVDRNWASRILAPVIHEAKAFAKQIDEIQIQNVRQAEEKELFLTIWEGENESFLILVNAQPNVRQVRQTLGEGLETAKLEPWGQTRETDVSLMNSSIVLDQIKPWEVLIWRVET